MNTKPQINLFKDYLVEKLNGQLRFIILEGSYDTDSWIKGWSDIDLLVGVKDLSYKLQIYLPTLSRDLGERSTVPVSLDAISLKQATLLDNFLFWNHPKMAQALYESYIFPDKLIYKVDKNLNLYRPSRKEIVYLSLKSVSYFYQEIHKSIQRSFDSNNLNRLRHLTQRVLKHSFNLTKFATQYKTLKTPQSKNEIISFAKNSFPDFDFGPLEKLLRNIQRWGSISVSPNDLKKLLARSLDYADTFVEYFSINHLHRHFGLIEDVKQRRRFERIENRKGYSK